MALKKSQSFFQLDENQKKSLREKEGGLE